MSSDPIYLDYNGTTPIDRRVADAMLPYLREYFGNPSSSHLYGRRAHEAIETARSQVASLLDCKPEEIFFTSGGTESNNLVLFGVTAALQGKGNHVVTSRVEHPAILEPCIALLEMGFDVTFLKVSSKGQVRVEDVEAAIKSNTVLVSIMHANNEVGTLQPIPEIAEITRKGGVLLHTDAAQSVGKIPTKVDRLGVDLMSIAGHKFYAPKGIGALYVKEGTPIERVTYGAGQERGLRPGTENVLEIVGLGEAAVLAEQTVSEESARLEKLRDRLQERLLRDVSGALVNGNPADRLPNTLSIAFPGMESDALLTAMSGLAASAGAACHSDSVKISHVLDAMGLPVEVAKGTLRFSLGRYTTADEIDRAGDIIVATVRHMQGNAESDGA